MHSAAERIFVPGLPPSERHPLIFSTFDALPVGAAFEIVNDHDPQPLYYQFDRQRGGQFAWQTLAAGPTEWQVRISRVRAAAVASSSGSCGGGGGGGCGCSGS
jgi:uncharacterized protein (DUF2249 family)